MIEYVIQHDVEGRRTKIKTDEMRVHAIREVSTSFCYQGNDNIYKDTQCVSK